MYRYLGSVAAVHAEEVVGFAASGKCAGRAVGGMEAVSRPSQPVWIGSSGRRRALSRRRCSSAHGPGRVLSPAKGCRCVNGWGLRASYCSAGEDCRRLKQCLMTPGIHGIFQC